MSANDLRVHSKKKQQKNIKHNYLTFIESTVTFFYFLLLVRTKDVKLKQDPHLISYII